MDPEERQAARVLVVDPQERVLLLRGVDPGRPEAGEWWFTPGGGLDPGEDHEGAALRELEEETGLRLPGLGPQVWWRVADFTFMGREFRQREVFYLARVDPYEVSEAQRTALEREAVLGHRWWSLDELADTDERVYPTDLAAELRRVLVEGAPSRPYEVGA